MAASIIPAWFRVVACCVLSACLVSAQSLPSNCSASTPVTISHQSDADRLTPCSTYSGDIVIATGVAENITFTNITQLNGSFTAANIPSSGFQLVQGDFQNIFGNLTISNVPSLTTLGFPSLYVVTEMHLTHLPAFNVTADWPHLFDNIYELQTLEIRNTNISYVSLGTQINNTESVVVIDNPQLAYVSFYIFQVGLLNISNNAYDAHAESIGNLHGLVPGKCTVDLGNLASAHDIYIQNSGYIQDTGFTNVTNSLTVIDTMTDAFEPYALTSVGGDFVISGAPKMGLLNPEVLQSVNGSLRIENATDLNEIHFSTLRTIGRDLKIAGDISYLALPNISSIHGSFDLESSKNISNLCSQLKSQIASDVKGTFTCGNGVAAASVPQDSEDQGLSTGAKAGIGAGVAVGALLIVGLIALLLIRRRKKKTAKTSNDGTEVNEKYDPLQPKAEPVVQSNLVELEDKKRYSELGRSTSTNTKESIDERHELLSESGATKLPRTEEERFEME